MLVELDAKIEQISEVIAREFPGCPVMITPRKNQYRNYLEFRIKVSAQYTNPLDQKLSEKFDRLYGKIRAALKDVDVEYGLAVA
ncbi:MAG: hypothetical protein LiPW30_771 [Parcubacteria group bacterium LiPW_30]|nr:MAG: hypothetical protein LiPW30_771 [Parcubacteria group bacterium LiPW_30]